MPPEDKKDHSFSYAPLGYRTLGRAQLVLVLAYSCLAFPVGCQAHSGARFMCLVTSVGLTYVMRSVWIFVTDMSVCVCVRWQGERGT